jgi:hypothetical protein
MVGFMNVTVAKLTIQCDYDHGERLKQGDVIAYKYVGEEDKGWQDPYGGWFDEATQKGFDAIATGETSILTIAPNTRYSHDVEARLVVTLK